MKITSTSLINDYFKDDCGKHGQDTSIGFEIHEAPANTQSFAFLFEDKDAMPVCGFSFIHWCGWNLCSDSIPEGASETADYTAGLHSLSKDHVKEHYVGMAPPDKDHTYELHVYALDCMINLDPNHHFNDLWWAMEGHILETATLKGRYRSK